MATTITRDGVILEQDELTEAQREEAWCIVFRAFLREHPEVLTGGQDAAEVCTASA